MKKKKRDNQRCSHSGTQCSIKLANSLTYQSRFGDYINVASVFRSLVHKDIIYYYYSQVIVYLMRGIDTNHIAFRNETILTTTVIMKTTLYTTLCIHPKIGLKIVTTASAYIAWNFTIFFKFSSNIKFQKQTPETFIYTW